MDKGGIMMIKDCMTCTKKGCKRFKNNPKSDKKRLAMYCSSYVQGMVMSQNELHKWMASAEFFAQTGHFNDEDNKYWIDIYKKDGKLYAINNCNGYPDYTDWKHGNLGYIEVAEHVKTIPAYTVPEKQETVYVYINDKKREITEDPS